MSTLELECPGCDQLLELDAGFAGGVCRCSNCGTLMTVPAEAGQAAEAVRQRPRRPDRPDLPAESSADSRPKRPSTPQESVEETAEEAAAPPTASPEQVYTTASGREVRVRESTAIPTAQRKTRLLVRAATAAIFASLVAVVLVLAGLGVWILSSAQQEAAVQPVLETFEYDPRLNPYQHPLANVLGMPLAERAVVVVDAVEASEPWLSVVNHALREGLSNTNSRSAVALVYANDQAVSTHPRRPEPVVHWREPDLLAFHSQVTAAGTGALGEAFEQALQWQPEQVILIIGRDPSEDEQLAMQDALDEAAEVTLDVVAINADSAALDDLSAEYNGRYALLTREQLEQWQSAADIAMEPAPASDEGRRVPD